MTLSVGQSPVLFTQPVDPSVLAKDIESQALTNKGTAKVHNGRTWKYLPASFGKRNEKHKGGGISCCTLGLLMAIVGACMWGICNDPTKSGCNDAIKLAGKVLVGVSYDCLDCHAVRFFASAESLLVSQKQKCQVHSSRVYSCHDTHSLFHCNTLWVLLIFQINLKLRMNSYDIISSTRSHSPVS